MSLTSVSPDFDKGAGLLPAIIQDSRTAVLLMQGFMNEAAWLQTQQTGRVTFFSRSKNRLWVKGETSGNFLQVQSVHLDCDRDSILIKAIPQGPVCHTGAATCWGEINTPKDIPFLFQLEEVFADRISKNDPDSYTVQLWNKGIKKIAQKVGEEATEVVLEAMDNKDDLFLEESADLLFHYLLLLKARGYGLDAVIQVLEKRHKP